MDDFAKRAEMLDGTPGDIPEDLILQAAPEAYSERRVEEWLGEAPIIAEADIKESVQADVVIVGAGIAGLCAARSAAEEGASVILLEKSTHFNARSGQYAVIGGKINEFFGRPAIDPDVVTERFMRESQYRVKRAIIYRWAKHGHEVFDWYIGAMPELYIARNSVDPIPPEHKRFCLAPINWPSPPEYDYTEEEFPAFPTSMVFAPGHAPLLKRILDICVNELGVKVFYAHKAEKLETADGRVTGVVARDMKKGGYARFTAKKGIVLTTGDNAGNPEILKRFYPSLLKHGIPLTPMRTKDAEGNLINTGDGLKLGAWVGAKVQEYHAVMAHNMGLMFTGMGNTPFLFLNKHGRRFMNECVPGQQLEDQLELQPGRILHQIFDDNWREQLRFMPPNHGSYSGYSKEPTGNHFDSIMDEQAFQGSLEKGSIVQADTIEELLDKLDIDKETALKSVARYNELAHKGHDDDFNKPAKRLFPVEKGPFYASTFGLSPMLTCIGGLESDEECRVYMENGDILPGLYVAGNVQGCVYAGEYPICTRGLSHSICMFYGYVAGKNAVSGV